MAENTFTFSIILKDANVVNSFNQIKSNLEKGISETTGHLNKGLSTFRSKLAEASLIYSGLMMVYNDVARSFGSMIRATAEAETADVSLESALRRTGQATQANITAVDQLSKAYMNKTTYDDEQIKNGLALFENITSLSASAFPGVTKAAIGLAAAMKIDLNTAYTLIGKGGVGYTAMLARQGIIIDTSKSKQEQFNQLIEKGGSFYAIAEAQGNTYAGRLAMLKNQFGELKEVVGAFIIQAIAPMLSTITQVLTFLNKSPEKIKALIAGIMATTANPVMALLKALLFLISTVYVAVEALGGWKYAWAILTEYASAALNIIWLYLKAFGIFVWNFAIALQKVLTLPWTIMYESAAAIFGKLSSMMKKLVAGDFKGVWNDLLSGVKTGTSQAITELAGSFNNILTPFTKARAEAALWWNIAGQRANAVATGTTPVQAGSQTADINLNPGGLPAAATDKGTTSQQVNEYKTLMAELDLINKDATDKLAMEYMRRSAIIMANTKLNSDEQKKYITELNAWEATEQAKIEAQKLTDQQKQKDNTKAGFEAQIQSFSQLAEMGVYTWDQVKAAYEAYIKWAEANLPADQVALLKAQLKQINLNWGRTQMAAWEDNHRFAVGTINSITDGFRTAWDVMIDKAMSGKQKMQAIWVSMRSSFMDMAGSMAAEWIKQQLKTLAMTLFVTKAKEAAAVESAAVTTATSGVEVAAATSVASANIFVAIAKSIAALGPAAILFGVVVAGTLIAMFAGIRKSLSFAGGGLFSGKGGPKDDANLAYISNGEYIVNAAATRQWLPVLESINGQNGRYVPNGQNRQAYADGGKVDGQAGALNLRSEMRSAIREELGRIEIIIDASSPNAKQWAKHIKLGNKQLEMATV
jgi:hypothetical protein